MLPVYEVLFLNDKIIMVASVGTVQTVCLTLLELA